MQLDMDTVLMSLKLIVEKQRVNIDHMNVYDWIIINNERGNI